MDTTGSSDGYSEGLERYILDLCSVIRELGHNPEVHQLSYYEAFQTRTEQIDVFGYAYDMDDVPEAFARMAAAARGGHLCQLSLATHQLQARQSGHLPRH